jgi:hypothetical protein
MGVPTTANYVIMATTYASDPHQNGGADDAAHMFVFYFGIVADITPPVCPCGIRWQRHRRDSQPDEDRNKRTKLAIAAFSYHMYSPSAPRTVCS